MSDSVQRPLPKPTAYSQPFWDAARERRLVIQRCRACEILIMYPKRFCPSCMSYDVDWVESQGLGRVYSFTVQERGGPTGFREGPYVLAVIQLDEGVQLMSNVVGDDAFDVKCGDHVRVDFLAIEDSEVVLPVFRLVGEMASS